MKIVISIRRTHARILGALLLVIILGISADYASGLMPTQWHPLAEISADGINSIATPSGRLNSSYLEGPVNVSNGKVSMSGNLSITGNGNALVFPDNTFLKSAAALGGANNNLTLNISSVLYVNSTTNNVGVGTAAPSFKLDVEGDAEIQNIRLSTDLIFTPNADLKLIGGGPQNTRSHIYLPNNGGIILNADSDSSQNIVLDARNNGGYILLNNGNVGIGTPSPELKLHVDTGNTANGALLLTKAASKPAFSILPWDSQVYISAGIYYKNGGWTQYSDTNDNELFTMDPGQGVLWYASNNGAGSWNVASGVQLWNPSGSWTNNIALGSGKSITIADGTQGAGKVLTSDANGVARWQTSSGLPASSIWAEVASANAGGGCDPSGSWYNTPCGYTVGSKGGNVGRFGAGGGGCLGGPGRLLVNGAVVSTGGGRVDIPVAAGSSLLVQVQCTANGCDTIQKASCQLGLWDY